MIGLATSFATTTAINEITQNGVTGSKTDQITARTVVLPSNFFAAYEALAVRLSSMTPGGELPIYVAPQGESKADYQGGDSELPMRRRPERSRPGASR